MGRKKTIFSILIFLLLTSLAFSFPSQESASKSEKIVVTGILRYIGNAPFSRLVLTDEKGNDYLLEGDNKEFLQQSIGRKVKIHGILERRPVMTANQKRLRDDLILTIETVEGL